MPVSQREVTRVAHYFAIKQNDLLPVITDTLLYDDGDPIDLTAATVNFHMRVPGGSVKVDAAATVVSGTAGTVSYTWAAGDTDTVGEFDAEWEATIGGKTLTRPGSGYRRIRIDDDIA